MVELMAQKVLILIKLMAHMTVLFVITGTFFEIIFEFESKVCNDCRNITRKSMNFDNDAVITVKGSDYRINFWLKTKSEALSRMKNTDIGNTI